MSVTSPPSPASTSSALEVKSNFCDTAVMDEALTIGEVAARSGVATSALRFYEEQGLIHSARTDAGHRRYPRAVIRRVAFVVFAQKIGLSLEEIRAELAKLPTIECLSAPTGRSCRRAGRNGFASALRSSSAWRRDSPSASAAAVYRWIAVSSRTPAIAWRGRVRGRGRG